MIEAALPAQTELKLTDCKPLELAVTSPPIEPSTYRYRWSVDGVSLPSTTSRVRLAPGALGPGVHDVQVSVTDATALVRSDPLGLLTDGYTWHVQSMRDDCPSGPLSTWDDTMTGGAAGWGEAAPPTPPAPSGSSAPPAPSGSSDPTSASGDRGAGVNGSAVGGSSAGALAAVPVQGRASAARANAAAPPTRSSSCSCTVPDRSPREGLSLAALAGAAALARRRRVRAV
jgi:MYXO-CTERM domain-containing protein